MVRAASYVLAAAIAAAVAGRAIFEVLPSDLDVRTDIVGYPTYANFNIDRYFWAYALIVVFFPLVTFALYLLLNRVTGRRRAAGPVPSPARRLEEVPRLTAWRRPLVAAGRVLLVGIVLALEAAVVLSSDRGDAFAVVAAVTAAYGVLVVGGAWIVARATSSETIRVSATVNALAAPLTVAALWPVSEATHVTVAATGARHDYPWLPAWLAVVLTVVPATWLVASLLRSAPAARTSIERQALLLVVGPVGVFLLTAYLPGAADSPEFFEEGVRNAAWEQVRHGAFPWRDILIPHGLLHDVGSPMLGTVVEDSRWGSSAGQTLLLTPLCWVAFYYLCAYLFAANWLFLLGSQLLVVTSDTFVLQNVIHDRFALVPFILLLLAALLVRATVLRAAAFTSLLAVQAILTPEAVTVAVSCFAAVALFELYYFRRGRRLAEAFRRTWLCIATGAALAAAWSTFLLSQHALDDFVFSYRAFVPGHRYTGGIPLGTYFPELPTEGIGESWGGFAVVVPVALVLASMLFVVARTRLRQALAISDWVMLASAALTLLYYSKFLSRSDHYLQSFTVAVPLLFYAAYRAITAGEAGLAAAAHRRGLSWFPRRHTITLPGLAILLAGAPVALADTVRGAPGRYAVTVPVEAQVERFGFANPGVLDVAMIRDVSSELGSLLEPGETVFDFSNSPGLFHYLLGFPAETRYYHVANAIRRRTQSDLIGQLERTRPGVVVFTSDAAVGLPSWDGIPNQVRHYDVSEYLLDNYVPVRRSHGFVFMRRRDEGARAQRAHYFDVPSCDWGFAPSFLSVAPEGEEPGLALPVTARRGQLTLSGWAVDTAARTPAVEVIATAGGRVVGRTHPRGRRPDVARLLRDLRYLRSGFELALPLSALAGDADPSRVRLFAVRRSGAASEIVRGSATSWPRRPATLPRELTARDGRPLRLAPDPGVGLVDEAGAGPVWTLRVPSEAADRYRWLELVTEKPLREGRFALSEKRPSAARTTQSIVFGALPRDGRRLRVQLAPCSQWRGWRSPELYLSSTVPQDVAGVRLLR